MEPPEKSRSNNQEGNRLPITSQPVIFLSAAHRLPPLQELTEELRGIEEALYPLRGSDELRDIISNRNANLKDIFNTFTRIGDQIRIFHYAGHAEGDELAIEQGGHIRGLAGLFGLAEPDDKGNNRLRLVFLNGCSTKSMVHNLHSAGVAVVIATRRKIGDRTARNFAETFYRTWAAENKTLQQAFNAATAFVQSDPKEAGRGIKFYHVTPDDDPEQGFPWGFYINPELPETQGKKILQWQLNPGPLLRSHPLARFNNTHKFDLFTGQFFGRESLIQDIKSNFRQGKRLQILHGMDGNGKTRLAAAYSREMERNGHYSNLIWWLDAQQPEYIEEELKTLAEKVFPGKTFHDFKEYRDSVNDWLRVNSDWLIIFDGAPTEKSVAPYIPDGNGHILITSSNKDWNAGLPGLVTREVPCLDTESAVALLLNRTNGRLTSKKALEWAESFEGYPILLEILADFFRDGSQSEDQFSKSVFEHFAKEHDNQKRFISILNSVFRQIPEATVKGWSGKFGLGGTLLCLSWLHSKDIPDRMLHLMTFALLNELKPEKPNSFLSKWWHRKVTDFVEKLSKHRQRSFPLCSANRFYTE